MGMGKYRSPGDSALKGLEMVLNAIVVMPYVIDILYYTIKVNAMGLGTLLFLMCDKPIYFIDRAIGCNLFSLIF